MAGQRIRFIMSRDQRQIDNTDGTETATLAGGCFWCLEAVFNEVPGIHRVVSGYTGGTTPNPTYDEVCTGATGHAEAVQVVFEPRRISFEQILRLFFTIHDPTTLNRQGADVGTQYRSAIFYHSEEQRAKAERVIDELNAAGVWDAPIVTEVVPLREFYAAEDYHQRYFERNAGQQYCRVVIAPKIARLRVEYLKQAKDT